MKTGRIHFKLHRITIIIALLVIMLALFFTGCEPERVVITAGPRGYQGQHIGYSWSGEARDIPFGEAGSFIETILELDEDGIIESAVMRYWQKVDGFWTTRQSGNAYVTVDFSKTPTLAGSGNAYAPGESMFTIYTANLMSLYAAAVAPDSTAAVTIVEPLTRYRFEMKFPPGFDYGTRMEELTIGSGMTVPVVRTSGGAFLTPGNWDERAENHIFDLHDYSHVLNDTGVFENIDGSSTVREFLESMDIEFTGGRPQTAAVRYGYFGIGGWEGNYRAIGEYLTGKNAREVTSLVDWSLPRFGDAVNDKGIFGADVPTGATRTAQNSVDGISGATVRMSRESTSYQRALVQAGILSESDVVIGRF